MKTNESKSLTELLDESKSLTELLELLDSYDLKDIDISYLPTFGGVEPTDTVGIWSWDEENLLIGEGDFEIISRNQFNEKYSQ